MVKLLGNTNYHKLRCVVFHYYLMLYSEIDKNIEQMTNLRKDKMVVDKKLRT